MKKFKFKENTERRGYAANILDIWCQGDKIVTYVQGTYIYKIEMIIKDGKIKNYYCSCPSSDGGMNFCKHLAGVQTYIKEKEIPELEYIEEEEEFDLNIPLEEIPKKLYKEISLLEDYGGRINCYNSEKFSKIVVKYCRYIDKYTDNKELDTVFSLAVSYYKIIDNFIVDSEDDYYEAVGEIISYIDKILEDRDNTPIVDNYILNTYQENEIDNIGIEIIDRLISDVKSKERAEELIKIINDVKPTDYNKTDLLKKQIELTYKFIDKEKAIKKAKANKNEYSINKLFLKYLEENDKKEDLIKELESKVKKYESYSDYNNLLEVYYKYNMDDKVKDTLLKMILKFNYIIDYQKLKSICPQKEIKKFQKEIVASLRENQYKKSFLMEIYNEDDKSKELYSLAKERKELYIIRRYKELLNRDYHNEIIEIYKKEIVKKASKVYGREEYIVLCSYIKDLYEINSTNEDINDLIKEMLPYYSTKKAFKEELLKVLKDENKEYLIQLTNEKVNKK